MSSSYLYRSATVVAIASFLTFPSGCVVAPDGGYYSGYNGYYGPYPGYYEPYGVFYGGWGPDYYVAPYRFRDGGGHSWHGAGHSFSHAMPSIPSRSRRPEFR